MMLLVTALQAAQPLLTGPGQAMSAPRAVSLDASSLLSLGEQMERRGQVNAAHEIYGKLTQDPDLAVRSAARFALARMASARGDLTGAAVILRALLAEQPRAANARLSLADLLVRMGDEAAARREIRAVQADDVLPDDVAQMVDRWSTALRARKPLGGSVSFAIAPDSNINRATRADTVGTVIGDFTINDDGRVRSGIGVALAGQGYARHAVSDRLSLMGRVSGAVNLYRDDQFNDLGIDLAVGPDLSVGRTRMQLEGGIGKRWYGGSPFIDYRRLGATVTQAIGRATQLRFSTSRTRLDHHRNNLQDGHASTAELTGERALSSRAGIALSLGGTRQVAADPGYSTRSWRFSLAGWREVGPAVVTGRLDLSHLWADRRLVLFPERRDDQFRALSFGVVMRRWQWMGLAPSLRVTRERNRSSVEFYDYRRTRTELGVTRAF